MVLNLFGVKLYRLSHSTRAELKRVSHMVHHQQEGESSPNGMAHTPQIEINNPHEAIEMAEIE
jgi:hypothetical protein